MPSEESSLATRARLVEVALDAFAERGFHGASLAAIARELDITKQALLHHFGRKEKLYGEVLQRVSSRYEALIDGAEEGPGAPEEKLERFLVTLHHEAMDHTRESRLLVRELLDNRRRAERAERWYLEGFLARLVAMVRRTAAWRDATDAEAFALVYQLLGAVTYFSISVPTLTRMYGADGFEARREAFPSVLAALTRSISSA